MNCLSSLSTSGYSICGKKEKYVPYMSVFTHTQISLLEGLYRKTWVLQCVMSVGLNFRAYPDMQEKYIRVFTVTQPILTQPLLKVGRKLHLGHIQGSPLPLEKILGHDSKIFSHIRDRVDSVTMVRLRFSREIQSPPDCTCCLGCIAPSCLAALGSS